MINRLLSGIVLASVFFTTGCGATPSSVKPAVTGKARAKKVSTAALTGSAPAEVTPVAAEPRAILTGHVFDLAGTPFLEGVRVSVAAADGRTIQTVSLWNGQWSVTNLPLGERLTVTATHPGSGLSKQRFVTPGSADVDRGTVVNFGGPGLPADPDAGRHALGLFAPALKDTLTGIRGELHDLDGARVKARHISLRALHGPTPNLALEGVDRFRFGGLRVGEAYEVRVVSADHEEERRTFVAMPLEGTPTLNFGGVARQEDPLAGFHALAPLRPAQAVELTF